MSSYATAVELELFLKFKVAWLSEAQLNLLRNLLHAIIACMSKKYEKNTYALAIEKKKL